MRCPAIKNQTGHTLVELMIAITVTSLVAAAVFAAYLGMYRQFSTHTARSEKVFAMVNAKTKMDGLFNGRITIKEYRKDKVVFLSDQKKGEQVLELKNNTLLYNGTNVIPDVERFSTAENDKTDKNGYTILDYEIFISGGGWVGGAVKCLIEEY